MVIIVTAKVNSETLNRAPASGRRLVQLSPVLELALVRRSRLLTNVKMDGGTAGKLQPQVGDTAGAGLKYLLIPTH